MDNLRNDHPQIITQIPTARKVLLALCEIDKNAIIAGGAPGDWFFAEPARDIDCYVFTRDIPKAIFYITTRLGLETEPTPTPVTVNKQNEPENYDEHEYVNEVWDFVYENEKFQIIFTKNDNHVEDVVKKFSCNMSQIWYDTSTLCSTTKFYDLGEKYKFVIVTGENKDYQRKCIKKWTARGFNVSIGKEAYEELVNVMIR